LFQGFLYLCIKFAFPFNNFRDKRKGILKEVENNIKIMSYNMEYYIKIYFILIKEHSALDGGKS